MQHDLNIGNEKLRRNVKEIFEDTGKLSETVLGIPISYQITMLPESKYIAQRREHGLQPNGKPTAYINDTDEILFIREDWASRISDTGLAGYIAYHGVMHFTFLNSNQTKREHFNEYEVLDGVAFYAQSLLKEKLSLSDGYPFDVNGENRLRARFFVDKASAIIGYDVAREQCQQSGQSKMIKPIILTSVNADNPVLAIHQMRGKYYVSVLKDSPLIAGIDYEISVSKDREIMENVRGIEHKIVQKREVRDAIPHFDKLVELLDDERDGKEKKELIDILREIRRKDQDRTRATLKLEAFPDYTILQDALINIAARRSEEERKFATIE